MQRIRSILAPHLRPIATLLAGLVIGGAATVAASYSIHFSGTPEFCMRCHEMRVVGEQGWMQSPHYRNDRGVVAGCSDCHVPPDLPRMLYVKTRDGVTDIIVHAFGEADPRRMDWDRLAAIAREKATDSACRACHQNLDARGLPIAAIVAHRENALIGRPKKCVACHRAEFHGRFRPYLEIRDSHQLIQGGITGGLANRNKLVTVPNFPIAGRENP